MENHEAPVLATERLILRGWTDADRAPFAAMNADPRVMEFFPNPLTAEESDALVDRIRQRFRLDGYGLWAVERRDDGALLGFTGLAAATFEAPFTPCIELGWRLAVDAWGHGYATEAARRVLEFGFDGLLLPEILSWTAVINRRSQAVMKRLGMIHDSDFDHPRIAEGDRLRRHALYRLSVDRWRAARDAAAA
ncbi:MAG: GNAT family N-acetyltransferase [Chloroflexota bacterium]